MKIISHIRIILWILRSFCKADSCLSYLSTRKIMWKHNNMKTGLISFKTKLDLAKTKSDRLRKWDWNCLASILLVCCRFSSVRFKTMLVTNETSFCTVWYMLDYCLQYIKYNISHLTSSAWVTLKAWICDPMFPSMLLFRLVKLNMEWQSPLPISGFLFQHLKGPRLFKICDISQNSPWMEAFRRWI